jgi:hypothetical protein
MKSIRPETKLKNSDHNLRRTQSQQAHTLAWPGAEPTHLAYTVCLAAAFFCIFLVQRFMPFASELETLPPVSARWPRAA